MGESAAELKDVANFCECDFRGNVVFSRLWVEKLRAFLACGFGLELRRGLRAPVRVRFPLPPHAMLRR